MNRYFDPIDRIFPFNMPVRVFIRQHAPTR
jgi:hypothetical protein